MSEPLLAHVVVCLESWIQIIEMNTDGASHEHVLWSLSDLSIYFEQIGALQSLETEEVIVEISLVVNDFIDLVSIFDYAFVNIFC